MAGILKVDRIQEANSGQGVELSHKLVDTSGNTIISENNGVATFGSSVAPSTNYTFRNKIINGNFDIWQRATSQTSSGYGSADRWANYNTGSTKTASQQAFTVGQTDVLGNPKYYLQHVVSSVAGAGNRCILFQRIEGVETLAGQTATLSFWAKADSNKNIATEFTQNFGTGGSPSAVVSSIGVTTHNLTTSWQKFTTTVSIPHLTDTGLAGGTPKTIGSDGNDYFQLIFWFDAGSDWNSRTNSLGQQSGTFDIAQVQVEEGTVATPFEQRPIGTELALCQRYFQAHYTLGAGVQNNTTVAFVYCSLPVTMRRLPDISTRSGVYTNINVEHDDTYDVTGVTNTHGITTGQRIEECSSFTASVSTTGTNTVGNGVCVMCDRNSDAFTFEAEL